MPEWEQVWKSQKECLYFIISLKAYSLVNAKPLDPDARHDNIHFVKKKYTWKTHTYVKEVIYHFESVVQHSSNLNHCISHVIIFKTLQLKLQNRREVKEEYTFFCILKRKLRFGIKDWLQ